VPDPPEPATFDIAAASQPMPAPPRPTIQRLPVAFDPAARFAEAHARRLPGGEPDNSADARQFARPEGSFAARSFGNAVHAFLEILAARIAAADSPAQLLDELPSWAGRIVAMLRNEGLPPRKLGQYARETRDALANTLRDPDGRWLLTPHPAAASELALTAEGTSIRIDRVFHAGAQPRATLPGDGEPFLWIVDYKTASHGGSGLDEFLAQQKDAYASQLETYARILAPARTIPDTRVRLGLYYPAIPRLVWWRLA
jgi:hypothetical protein